MTSTLALIVVTLLKLGAVGTGPRMLVGAEFAPDDLDASIKGTWLAVCRGPNANLDVLQPVEVRYTRTPWAIADGLQWNVRVDGCKGRSLLVRDLPKVDAPRPLPRAVVGNARGPRITLRFGEQRYVITDHKRGVESEGIKHRVVIRSSSGGRKQVLFNEEGERDPEIVWAGDLDGDGKLDLLINVPCHESATDVRLFLSTAAKGDALVGQVASQYTGSC